VNGAPVNGGSVNRGKKLVFAGEAIVDVAMDVPAFPAPGADVLAGSSQITVGGGFNVMAAAARQGLPVLYAGGHGTGPWGDLVRKALAAEGIEVLRDPDPDRDTGFAVGLTRAGNGGPDGDCADVDCADVDRADVDRAYATRLGAESHRVPGCLDEVLVEPGDLVYLSGYGLLSSGAVLSSWAADLPPGALLFCDPGPLAARIPASVLERVLPRCDWLSCNEREAAQLSGAEDPAEAARVLASRARNVIVRTGPDGCFLGSVSSGSASLDSAHVPAPGVTVVDTTGAGDAHAGAFLAALAEGLSPLAAARRANAAAAFSVTRRGPATAPTRAELELADLS
jgi:sugar/nucleoside kinase (ribokinase family)